MKLSLPLPVSLFFFTVEGHKVKEDVLPQPVPSQSIIRPVHLLIRVPTVRTFVVAFGKTEKYLGPSVLLPLPLHGPHL